MSDSKLVGDTVRVREKGKEALSMPTERARLLLKALQNMLAVDDEAAS